MNLEQCFVVSEENATKEFKEVKIEFLSSSDFFGRIIVYKLELMS